MTVTHEHGPAAFPTGDARDIVFRPATSEIVADDTDANPETAAEQQETDNRPDTVSPIARALNRVGTALTERAQNVETRAMDRIHDQALEENSARDLANSEHDGNVDRDTESTSLASEGLDDGLTERENRAETLKKSKDVLKKIGRGALKTLAITGLVGLGAGVLAGQAGAKGIKRGTKAAASAIESTKQASRERKKTRTQAKIERQDARNARIMERLKNKRLEAERRATQAKSRKQARHAKWEKKWKASKERVVGGYESALTMSKNGKARVGRVATRTRRFGVRAYTAGKAAKEAATAAWRDFDKE